MKDLLKKLPKKRGKLQETCDLAASFIKKPFFRLHAWLNYHDRSVVVNFADMVNDAKNETGITQTAIADKIGVAKGTISKWMNNPPTLEQIEPMLVITHTKPELKAPVFSECHISRKGRSIGVMAGVLLIAIPVAFYVDASIFSHERTGSWNPFMIFNPGQSDR